MIFVAVSCSGKWRRGRVDYDRGWKLPALVNPYLGLFPSYMEIRLHTTPRPRALVDILGVN